MDTATGAAPKNDLDARLQAIAAELERLNARQERADELWSELMPVGREVLRSLATRLDEAERKGWLQFGREALLLGERVLERYSAEDVRRLGEAIVPILDAVRALTQPKVVAIASDAAAALEQAGEAKPVGLLGAVRATRDDEVQRGIAVLLEVLRKVGQAARAAPGPGAPALDQKERLARALGPSRRPRATLAPLALPAEAAPARPARPAAPAACAAPRPAALAAVVDGVGFTADGYLTDATQWDKGIAERLALASGLALVEAHWKVIDAARADYAQTKASPNIRRLTQIQPLGTRELYALFPHAPGRTIARLAGLPKPAGCL